MRIELDLRDRVRLSLKDKGRPIETYKISPAPHLFGSSAPPHLPIHTNGLRYLPIKINDKPRWLILTWKQGSRFYEVVRLFTPTKARIVLDVDTLKVERLGDFELIFGERNDWSITLERISPAPPTQVTRYWRMVVPTKGQTRVTVTGAPPGRYRLRIKRIRHFPNAAPLLEVTKEMNGQKISIDIEELMTGR